MTKIFSKGRRPPAGHRMLGETPNEESGRHAAAQVLGSRDLADQIARYTRGQSAIQFGALTPATHEAVSRPELWRERSESRNLQARLLSRAEIDAVAGRSGHSLRAKVRALIFGPRRPHESTLPEIPNETAEQRKMRVQQAELRRDEIRLEAQELRLVEALHGHLRAERFFLAKRALAYLGASASLEMSVEEVTDCAVKACAADELVVVRFLCDQGAQLPMQELEAAFERNKNNFEILYLAPKYVSLSLDNDRWISVCRAAFGTIMPQADPPLVANVAAVARPPRIDAPIRVEEFAGLRARFVELEQTDDSGVYGQKLMALIGEMDELLHSFRALEFEGTVGAEQVWACAYELNEMATALLSIALPREDNFSILQAAMVSQVEDSARLFLAAMTMRAQIVAPAQDAVVALLEKAIETDRFGLLPQAPGRQSWFLSQWSRLGPQLVSKLKGAFVAARDGADYLRAERAADALFACGLWLEPGSEAVRRKLDADLHQAVDTQQWAEAARIFKVGAAFASQDAQGVPVSEKVAEAFATAMRAVELDLTQMDHMASVVNSLVALLGTPSAADARRLSAAVFVANDRRAAEAHPALRKFLSNYVLWVVTEQRWDEAHSLLRLGVPISADVHYLLRATAAMAEAASQLHVLEQVERCFSAAAQASSEAHP